MEFELTPKGRAKIESYIVQMKAKRKEILDARLDEADDVEIPTVAEIFEDLCDVGLDDGELWNEYPVTNNYDADFPVFLTVGLDFIIKEV